MSVKLPLEPSGRLLDGYAAREQVSRPRPQRREPTDTLTITTSLQAPTNKIAALKEGLKHPETDSKKHLRGETPPPAYIDVLPMLSKGVQPAASNQRLVSKTNSEAIEIINDKDAHNADRIEVPREWSLSMPCTEINDNCAVVALSHLEPEAFSSLSLVDLKARMRYLSQGRNKKIHIKWWNGKGALSTKRLFHDNTHGVTAATAAVLMMHVRGADVLCERMLSVAPTTVSRQLVRLGVDTFITAENIDDVLSDAVYNIVDYGSIGTQSAVAKSAAESVYQYLRSKNAVKNVDEMKLQVGKLIENCASFENSDMSGALAGIVLSGLFKYISVLQDRDRATIKVVRNGTTLALSALEEAPGGKIAAQIIGMAIDYFADEMANRSRSKEYDAARDFMMDSIKFPTLTLGHFPGAEQDYNAVKTAHFFMWLNMTLEANGFGGAAPARH